LGGRDTINQEQGRFVMAARDKPKAPAQRKRPLGGAGKAGVKGRGARPGVAGKGRKARGESDKPPDKWFDLWLAIEGEALHAVAKPLLEALDAEADAATPYKRGAAKRELLKERARVAIANLAYAVIKPPPSKRIAVSLMNGSKTRYDSRLMRGDHLRGIIGKLEKLGVISMCKGEWAGPFKTGVMTTIEPTPEFASEVEAHGITTADFRRLPDQEVLLLKRADPANAIDDAITEANEDGPNATAWGAYTEEGVKQSRWVDYKDCDTSIALRQQVLRLGEFIAGADIRHATTGERFNTTDCLLRRHFTQPPNERAPRWDLNGRLFYRHLSHLDRAYRKGLTINGSAVVELDFKAMFPTLAYGLINTPMPDGDHYGWQGFETYRDGVKVGFNALLFGGGRGELFGKAIRDALPKAINPEAFRNAFLRHHPALEQLLTIDVGGGLPIGYKLMNTESRLMVLVLERLMESKVTAIGLHDGLIIGAEHVALARSIMGDTALKVAGVSIPVELKTA
jgi:hypothetical protein